jgi:hypothetical protein
MSSRIRFNAKTAYRYGLFLLLFLLSINCIIWDLGGEKISQDVFSGTYTAISREQTEIQREIEDDIARDTEWADYNNTYATNQAATYQAILSATPIPPSAPVIDRIEFLSTIIGDGQTNYGSLYFHDNNGDVNRLTLDVVSASNFGGADYNPNDYLVAGDYTAGVYKLFIWCEGSQDVTLRAMLHDTTGLKSNPVNFSFTCE